MTTSLLGIFVNVRCHIFLFWFDACCGRGCGCQAPVFGWIKNMITDIANLFRARCLLTAFVIKPATDGSFWNIELLRNVWKFCSRCIVQGSQDDRLLLLGVSITANLGQISRSLAFGPLCVPQKLGQTSSCCDRRSVRTTRFIQDRCCFFSKARLFLTNHTVPEVLGVLCDTAFTTESMQLFVTKGTTILVTQLLVLSCARCSQCTRPNSGSDDLWKSCRGGEGIVADDDWSGNVVAAHGGCDAME
mmetsp:Transcript_67005/g.187303  ORF Transcript_67005/g.187303 Transcript_67005/m.187303 type:complete len:246 (-) Transcript_67005:44-781(-)